MALDFLDDLISTSLISAQNLASQDVSASGFYYGDGSNLINVKDVVIRTFVSSASSDWETAYTNLVSNSAAYLSATDLSFLSVSGNWNNTFSNVQSNSANWNSGYTYANTNSAGNIAVNTTVISNSANWNSAYTNLVSNSAAYLSATDLTFLSVSGNWNAAYTYVSSNSAANNNTNTTVNSNSANWNTGYTYGTIYSLNSANPTFSTITVNGSALIGSMEIVGDAHIQGNLTLTGSATYINTTVQMTSAMSIVNNGTGPALSVTQNGNQQVAAFYDGSYPALIVDGSNLVKGYVGIGTVNPNTDLTVIGEISATNTIYASSYLGGNTSNWNSAYTNLVSNSAAYLSATDLSFLSVSSNWNSAYTNLVSNSAAYLSATDLSFLSVSSNWNNTTTTVKSNSANWNSAYTNLVSNSAAYLSATDLSFLSVSSNWNTGYAYSTAYNLSASNYNNTFSTVQSNSANWILNTTTISGVNGLSGGGNLSTNQTLSLDFTRSNIWTGQQTFNTTNASTVGSIIKGTTSQTADLLQFQNSAGSVMQKIKADGTTTIIGTSATETPILGSELLTTAQWTSANWTGNFTTGFSHISSATIDSLVSNISAVKSLYYTLNITISNRTAGSVTMNFGGLSYPTIISSNIYADISTSTSPFIIIPTNDFSGTVIVSVKQIIAPSNPILSVIDSLGNTINEIRTGASTRYSTFIGVAAGGYHTKVLFPVGASNNAFGYTALQHLTMGTQNDAFGSGAGTSITSGNNNVCFGYFAGNGITTGGDNVCLGAYSAPINNGSYNISIGAYSSQSNTTGGYNTSIGNCASNKNTVGNFNVSMGNGSLFSNLSGGFNIALGNTSLYTSLGNNNIGLGAQAGYFWTGSNMLFVDSVANYNRKTVADNLSASIITGVMAVSPVNQILTFNALVGINAQSPSAQFQINPITTSTVGQIISSISGQTADLLQFRNNAGTILANINNSGALSAASITKTGGTASQFLKADGSVDSNTYLTSSGGLTLAYTAQTANYGIQSTDYLINCTTNSFSVTLPSATSIAGKVYIIKNSGTGNITILTTSSQTIDGQSSGYWIISNKNSMELMSDGANWIIT